MYKSSEEILCAIDATLDQLITNTETINEAPILSLCDNELDAMNRTQESLIARFIHMNELLELSNKINEKGEDQLDTIEQKMKRFRLLNNQLLSSLTRHVSRRKTSKVQQRRKQKALKQR